MKKQDLYFIAVVLLAFAPFVFSNTVLGFYTQFNEAHGMFASFVKFAVLATLGETIGLRIKEGVYWQKGFGLLPRAITWGVYGLLIKIAFVIFATGTPLLLEYLGLKNSSEIMQGGFSSLKLFIAFCISLFMNLIFSPVFMTAHKITDTHILNTKGTLQGYFSRIQTRKIIATINWDVHYNFVLKKTIPLFWIPAHTLTFLLPPEFQILVAALLGVALGIILSLATINKSA